MESLKKLRQPAALVLVVVLGVRVLLAVVTAVAYARVDFGGDFDGLAGLVSYRAGDPVLVLVLTALVASCVLTDPTPQARGLATAALLVTGVSVLVALAFAVIGATAGSAVAGGTVLAVVNTLDLLAALAVPVLAVVALTRLRVLAPLRPGAAGGFAVSAAPEQLAVSAPPPAGRPDEQYLPSWLPDTATGAAWQRAGDAAAGAPASGWGATTPGAGWTVGPTGPAPSGPPADPRSDQGGWAAPPPPPPGWDRPRS